MDDLGVFALLFELLLLVACASLCASFVVIPTEASTAQERLQWRRLSTVAASAAAAATEEVCPSPSPATVQVIRVAAQAASAATATALAQDQVDHPSLPWVASASTDHAGGGGPGGRDQGADVARGRGGDGRGRGGAGRGWGVAGRGVERPRSGEGRKPRTPISLGDKLALIEIRDAGHTWPQTLAMFRLSISVSAARAIYKNKEEFRRRAAASEDLSGTRQRRSYFEAVSQGLWDWYQAIQRVGGRHLPVSGGLLEARARRIATELGVTGFKGSPHFIQNWAARHNLHNVALWGQGGSADVAGAAARIAEIRSKLEAYPAERIYNMDETGLFFRCIPNRAYVKAGQRRQARGTKAMKAKDRVTLVLACNATGTHKIPVAMIGKAKQPLCFKPPRRPCPLPYFSQTNAWMDGDLFKSWFETVFLPAVRARTSQPVALVSDNCGAHEELECDKVKFIPLPPNCTSIYQPLDLGIIACLKRRYKRRLLDLVVRAFEASSGVGITAPRIETGVVKESKPTKNPFDDEQSCCECLPVL